MKTTKYLALLLDLATLLCGCGPDGETKESETSDNAVEQTDPVETDPVETDEPAEFISLFGSDSSKDYVIINGNHNAESAANMFSSSLMQKTGRTLKLKDSGTEETANEIIIGYVANREESVKVYDEIAFSEYYIGFVNNKLVIASYTSAGFELAFDYVAAYITKSDDGEYGFMSDFEHSGKGVRVDFDVPKVVTKRGYVLDGAASNSMLHLAYKNVTSEEVVGYGTLLRERGYTEHSTNTIGTNKFAT